MQRDICMDLPQFDAATQQNAALVEQAAAAAEAMQEQASSLAQAVSVFKIREIQARVQARPAPLAQPRPSPRVPARPAARLARGGKPVPSGELDWEEF